MPGSAPARCRSRAGDDGRPGRDARSGDRRAVGIARGAGETEVSDVLLEVVVPVMLSGELLAAPPIESWVALPLWPRLLVLTHAYFSFTAGFALLQNKGRSRSAAAANLKPLSSPKGGSICFLQLTAAKKLIT